jgi:hypothetical protein
LDSTHLRALPAAADAPVGDGHAWLRRRRRRRRRFALELDRRGVFVRLGRTETYLCAEPDSAWILQREPGALDAQAWRLHLVIDRVPAG